MQTYNGHNYVKLIYGGQGFFNLLHRLIEEATSVIHLQVYIFENDYTGNYIAEALLKAAKRNVKVYMLVDGYASQHLPAEFIQKLQGAGIHFRFFEPVFSSKHFYFGRRLHHKVIVVDQAKALVGGINISDNYNDVEEKKAWFDAALYVEGEVCDDLSHVCERLWNKKGNRRWGIRYKVKKKTTKKITEQKNYPVRIRRNDWIKGKQEIGQTYFSLFRKAKKDIVIICSYFLPGERFRKQIKRAVRRGVKVTVVLAGLSDVPVAKYAERYLYRWMLRNGITIYEYQPVVLHAKMAIVDNEYFTIGSYNINNLSELASIELNLEVDSSSFAENTGKEIQNIIDKDCKPVTFLNYPVRFFSITQFFQWGAFYIISLLLKMSTFYFRREK